MRFRQAVEADHPLLSEYLGGCPELGRAIPEAWVTDNEEGQRYWVAALPYAFGQIRLQTWLERYRGEKFPSIFHQL